MWIQRTIQACFAEVMAERPVVAVTGCRQAGKTSLLEHMLPDCAYISLDSPILAEEAEQSGDNLLERLGTPLIIDEIQYAPKLLRHIKRRVDLDRQRDGQYFLTGSQKFQLMAGVSESLAGRVGILDCHSLSAWEVEQFTGCVMERDALLKYIFNGGYPEIYARQRRLDRFYSDYVATYLERDVRQVLQVRNLRDFDRFMRLLAVRNGQLVSAHALASDLQVSPHTVRSWLAVLEASNIVMLLEPYYRNLGKRLVKTPKLYFFDTGLACYLAGIDSPEALGRSALVGAMFETHVAGQILRYFHNRGERPPLYFYRDHQGHEVDFVLAAGEKLHLLECKWGEHPSPHVPGFSEILKLMGPAGVLSQSLVTPLRERYDTSAGVRRCDSIDFRGLFVAE